MAEKTDKTDKTIAAPAAASTYSGMTPEQMLEALTLVVQSSQRSDPALADLAAGLKAMTEQQNRLHRPSNQFSPGISAFSHPEGEVERPKARLMSDVFFEGVKQSEEQLTPREIDLFNSFTTSKEARQGKWRAIYEKNHSGKKGRLAIMLNIGGNLDEGLQLPTLTQILVELSTGADATDVVKLFDQIEALKQQVSQLMAGIEAGHVAPAGV